jgi:hypothetical protein
MSATLENGLGFHSEGLMDDLEFFETCKDNGFNYL